MVMKGAILDPTGMSRHDAETWRSPMAVTSVLDQLLSGEVVDSTDVARALGTAPKSVNRWSAQKSSPRRNSEEKLLELKAVVDVLRTVLSDEAARLWLRSPNADLDWQKPLDVLASGGYRSVIGVILAMAEGVTA